jgi:transcription elongation factor GreA
MEKIHLTKEGLDRMKAEVAQITKRRREVAANIEHARSLGDLKENAEYHAAKEEQGMLHAKLRDLEDKIARSVIIDEKSIDASKAFIGATVCVLNHKSKKEVTYTLVSPVEADLDTNRISVKSPVGQALLGKAVGDIAIAKVPAGELKLEILTITR